MRVDYKIEGCLRVYLFKDGFIYQSCCFERDDATIYLRCNWCIHKLVRDVISSALTEIGGNRRKLFGSNVVCGARSCESAVEKGENSNELTEGKELTKIEEIKNSCKCSRVKCVEQLNVFHELT